MKNSLKQFGKRLAILLVLLIILDVITGKLLTPLYLNQQSGSAFKTVYAVEKCREPLVILGSSRAYHHYRTTVLEKRLGMEGYNLGRDGAGILYDYAIYNTICTRAIPKYLILDINMEEFVSPSVTYELLYQLLPHYNKNDYIKEVVNKRSRFECIKAQSSLYRYNSQLFYMLVYNYKSGEEEKGYLPLFGKMHDPADLPAEPEVQLDSVLVRYFEKLIQQAQANKTKVFVFISPTFNSYKTDSKSALVTKAICRKYHVPFQSFVQDSLYRKHPEYFNDYSHLNIQGATLYSNRVADAILLK